MNYWPTSPLGQVLTHRKEFIVIDDFQSYKRCRVQLHAQGIVLRDTAPGSEIKTKKQQVCRAGEFLVAEIDAKSGGFGIIPPSLNGSIVSSHYFLFEVIENRVDRQFLDYFIRIPSFRNQVNAQGSTNYAAIRPSDVLSYTMPLPHINEQRRLVGRIEQLTAKVNEARKLREEADAEYDSLCRSVLLHGHDEQALSTPMRELVRLRSPDVEVQKDESYHFAGVYCFGRGVFVGQQRTGLEFAYPRLTRLRANDFVYPKLMAWEGALAIVPPECDGLVVSTEFPVFEIDQAKVLPEVLDVYFRSPSVWPKLSGASTGTNVRRRRLNPSDFLSYRMPLPPMRSQLRLQEVYKRVNAIKKVQAHPRKELSNLASSILEMAFQGKL